MKRTIFGVVAVAAIALVPAVSNAQRANHASAAKPYTFSIGAGLSVPTGDMSNGSKTGFNLQGAVQHALGMSPAWLRGEVAFHRFGSQNLGGADGHQSELGALANIGYSFPTTSKVRPYVLGGLGLYSQKYSVEQGGVNASISESDLGFNGGLGVSFPMAGRKASLEARYHSVSGGNKMGNQTSTFVPVTFSMSF
jgi:opacity protein-like surface antigen